jgi:hypothetical protein
MKKVPLLLVFLFVFGCANTALKNSELRHENSESRLLTEEEFTDRVSQTAVQIYEDLRTIIDAAKQNANDNDVRLPPGNPTSARAALLDGGHLKEWPVVPPFAFTDVVQHDYRYMPGYADMDGYGARDDVVFAQDLKIEVCEEFIRRYSSAGPDDIIYDYEANGEKYPGEVLGTHMKIYAIAWDIDLQFDYCDIEWVLQYNGVYKPKTERRPEK